jgi:hypothetical protein
MTCRYENIGKMGKHTKSFLAELVLLSMAERVSEGNYQKQRLWELPLDYHSAQDVV